MDNTARKIIPFQYIDLEQFESEIRADERRRIKERMRLRKERRAAIRAERRKILIRYAIQKSMGAALIILSIWAVTSGLMYDPVVKMNDGTFLLITIPLGLFMIFTKELME